jgi:hypothetical protein
MKIIAKLGEFVNRKGIYPPLPDADKVQSFRWISSTPRLTPKRRRSFREFFFGQQEPDTGLGNLLIDTGNGKSKPVWLSVWRE